MKLPDVLVLSGLAGIGYGFWLLHPSLTFLSVGGAVLWFGVYLYRKPAAKPAKE